MTAIDRHPGSAFAARPGERPVARQPGRRVVDLDGQWGFIPHDVTPGQPAPDTIEMITVPGLWETQGWLDLDGPAWYVRHVDVGSVSRCWTLRFAAVMDEAEVYVNGQLVATHVGGYTPFSCDVTHALRAGRNELAVRVLDPPANTERHLRSAHGKQGWKNDVFPSPPSLYMTYGGIWQSVTLTQHDEVTVDDAFVNGDPGAGLVRVRIRNRGPRVTAVVECAIDDDVTRAEFVVEEASEETVTLHPDLGRLARWSPDQPALHSAHVHVLVDDRIRDERSVRFGVRTVVAQGDRILVNGVPQRISAALVQGYRADTLYAEGTRADIEQEVLAAKALGLNTLRLHIKAFDPVYLDVCDELGMFVHCDMPLAEPVAVAELDDTGPLATTCVSSVVEQVSRDRNHPCIVMWTAMNEIGADDLALAVRASAGYERFVNLLYNTIDELDGTRPIIENDFIEADPACVYRSPVLTAHWYGRLTRQYLTEVLKKALRSVDPQKVLLVTEFGDWALPSLHHEPLSTSGRSAQFWWPAQLHADVTVLPWPGTVEEFVQGTQMYKGIADRLQIELFRRVVGVGGWCLTQLTDVPHEYNGLWELDRTPKAAALHQVAAACRPTLPMALHVRPDATSTASTPKPLLGAWNGWTGEDMHLSLVVSHDAPEAVRATVVARVGPSTAPRPDPPGTTSTDLTLIPHNPTSPVSINVSLPQAAGRHTLALDLAAEGLTPVRNVYDIHVFERRTWHGAVSVLGADRDAAAVCATGATTGAEGPLVVGEAAATAGRLSEIEHALRAGRNVLLLAQDPESAGHLPLAASMVDIATEWGSLPFLFSTNDALLSAVPASTVVTTELLSITPRHAYTSLGGTAWTERLVLGMYKPDPERFTASVVGAIPVHRAHVWFCQLPLVDAALADDPTAVTTLSELIRAVAQTPVVTT